MRTFSKPINKRKAIEFYINCMSGFSTEEKEGYIDYLDSRFTDVKFLKEFNKCMTIELRMFAPNMYQVVYNNN